MSQFFNADFEQQIFSNSQIIKSNKINQELEYFLFYLESDSVFTTKKYSKEYKEHVEKLGGKVITTDKDQNVKCWWSSYEDLEKAKELNSKITSTNLAIINQLCHKDTSFISKIEQIQEGFIYKDPRGFSGKGIYKSSEVFKIKKLLLETKLIAEPLLNRVMDISFLKAGVDEIVYQNDVDDYFQYKGTLIGYLDIDNKLFEQFKNAIKIVKQFMHEKNASDYWSMDGFIYLENNNLKLYALSEINYRKTMGYIALKLHNLWNKKGVSKLVLIPSNKIVKRKEFLNQEGMKQLSPMDTRFSTFFITGKDIEDFKRVYDNFNQLLF